MIKVIEKTTQQRKEETVELFNEVKPLLDEGIPFYKAVKKVKNLSHFGFANQAWYREVRDYAKSQGYEPRR